jgi:hypothetical protein
MNRHDVRLLQAIREYPSVSIILPAYRTAPENLKHPIRVKNLVKEAEDRLLQEFTWREVDSLTSRLNDLVERINYQYMTEGLAIYANKDFSRRDRNRNDKRWQSSLCRRRHSRTIPAHRHDFALLITGESIRLEEDEHHT